MWLTVTKVNMAAEKLKIFWRLKMLNNGYGSCSWLFWYFQEPWIWICHSEMLSSHYEGGLKSSCDVISAADFLTNGIQALHHWGGLCWKINLIQLQSMGVFWSAYELFSRPSYWFSDHKIYSNNFFFKQAGV